MKRLAAQCTTIRRPKKEGETVNTLIKKNGMYYVRKDGNLKTFDTLHHAIIYLLHV